ncbi:MAG: ERCC4 domain-containing protein [Candidatus Aenigmatarchaeota archaeon]
MSKVLIFVDTRESLIIDYFKQYDCTVQRKMLLMGDFIVSDRIVIEKKTVNDFINSITDKRLFIQLKAMKDNFEKPLLLIEGTESLYGQLNPNIIRGVLSAITVDMGIPILWTRDLADTAGLIYWIAKREQIDERREVSLKDRKVPKTIEGHQEYLIASLPDISIVRSKALLKHFKSPKNIFNASAKELQEVKGVGKKIAEKIKNILEKDYL